MAPAMAVDDGDTLELGVVSAGLGFERLSTIPLPDLKTYLATGMFEEEFEGVLEGVLPGLQVLLELAPTVI